jgi:hypothetical protein
VRDLLQALDDHIRCNLQIAGLGAEEFLRFYDFSERFRGIWSGPVRDLERFLLLQHVGSFQELLEGGFIQRRLFPFAYDGLLQVLRRSGFL